MGDRFGCQGRAQLQACVQAARLGVTLVPVWNKSHREHALIGSAPDAVRAEAAAAVAALNWSGPYHVDADHIRLNTVDGFIAASDFFTIDVADSIGAPAAPEAVRDFVTRHPELVGAVSISALGRALEISRAEVERGAAKFLRAVAEAERIYRHIAQAKGAANFITEVSMDETDTPQTPAELLLILAALADEGVPLQTIAPKFTGRFNKGVDYVGDVGEFEREFGADLAVLAFARGQYSLPSTLKLSVHSGSDKFSLYPPIHRALRKMDAGIHVKTAGTTWLEELIGLAEAGGSGLELAREIYARARAQAEELCAPYATVIAVNPARLPTVATVAGWSASEFVAALRHEPANPAFNPDFRQLLHVSFKVAAKLGDRYVQALREHEASIARNVTENLFVRHLQPLFLAP